MEEIIELKNQVKQLTKDISELDKRMTITEAGLKDVKEDLKAIKGNTTWLLRIVIGAVIMALLNLIIKGDI